MRRNGTCHVRHAAALALASALGCGGKAANDAEGPAPLVSPPPASAPQPPLVPGVSRPPAPPPPVSPPPLRGQPTRPSEGLRQAVVENILMTYCGACHGPVLGRDGLGGIGFIDDLAELTERGYVVPLNSDASRLIQVIRDGSMPPPSSGAEVMPDEELLVLIEYIDDPLVWPGVPLPPLPAVDGGVPAALDAGAAAG